jgi:outer membrane protein
MSCIPHPGVLKNGGRVERAILLLSLVLALYAAIITTILAYDRPGLAYVDSSVLLEKFKGSIAARRKLAEQSREWRNNIKALQAELSVLNEETLEAPARTKETRTQRVATIERKRDELVRYSLAIEKKSAQLERELMQPVFSELNAYVKEFASQHSYSIVFGTVAGGNILYARPVLDVTEALLKYANERNGG